MWGRRKLQAGVDLDEKRAIRRYLNGRRHGDHAEPEVPESLSAVIGEAERRWEALDRLERALQAR